MFTTDPTFNRATASPADRAAFLERARVAAPKHSAVIDSLIGGRASASGVGAEDESSREVSEVLELISDGAEVTIGDRAYQVRKPKMRHARALAGPLGDLLTSGVGKGEDAGKAMLATFMHEAGEDTPLGRSIDAIVGDCFGESAEWLNDLPVDDALRAVEVACALIPFAALSNHFRAIGQRLASVRRR